MVTDKYSKANEAYILLTKLPCRIRLIFSKLALIYILFKMNTTSLYIVAYDTSRCGTRGESVFKMFLKSKID